MGSPASSWATPMVNGLHTPAAKPHPAASRLMPMPVKASQPKSTAKATTMGTRGTHSSKEPIIEPIAIKISTISAINRYRTPRYRLDTLVSMYFISLQRSRQVKTPPITSRKTITAIKVPFPEAPRTKKGDRIHFQKAMPPSIGTKSAVASITRLPASSNTLV